MRPEKTEVPCSQESPTWSESRSKDPQPSPRDRFIWILDGYAEIHTGVGRETRISQGESTVLHGGEAYRLVFPTLTLYLMVEPGEEA